MYLSQFRKQGTQQYIFKKSEIITFGFQKIPLQIWKSFSKNHYYHSALCLNPAIYINLGSAKMSFDF